MSFSIDDLSIFSKLFVVFLYSFVLFFGDVISEDPVLTSLRQGLMPFGQQAGGRLVNICKPKASATVFVIRNNCPNTIWAAALPGGGRQLDQMDEWILELATSNPQGPGRIWARTNCTFDFSGRGECQSGDCGGLLQCQISGTPPNTLAEYSLNQLFNMDFFDIALVDGFNVPMKFSSTSKECSSSVSCIGDINGECPAELKAPGGCNSPCTVFNTTCCSSGKCGATNYVKFFKDRCPNAFSYPMDDRNNTFTCPTGTSYKVEFCP